MATPIHQIGREFRDWQQMQVGQPVVIRRGGNAYFFGTVVNPPSLMKGMFSGDAVRVSVDQHFHNGSSYFVSRVQRLRTFDRSARTAAFEWNQNAAAPAQPTANIPMGSTIPPPIPPSGATTFNVNPHYGEDDEARQRREARKRAQEAAAEARRNARKGYVAARDIIQRGRDTLAEHCQVLGVSPTITKDEFKQLRRSVMLSWHPDRMQSFLRDHFSMTEAGFKEESEKHIAALAFLEQYITRRDSQSVQ